LKLQKRLSEHALPSTIYDLINAKTQLKFHLTELSIQFSGVKKQYLCALQNPKIVKPAANVATRKQQF
jgi:hypothetical protein